MYVNYTIVTNKVFKTVIEVTGNLDNKNKPFRSLNIPTLLPFCQFISLIPRVSFNVPITTSFLQFPFYKVIND